MGKIKNFIFSNEKQCDTIDRNTGMVEEQFTIGLSTFDTILQPAFTDSNGIEYRIYDRGNPYALIPITKNDIEALKKISRQEWQYSEKEIEQMEEIVKNNERLKVKKETIEYLREKGFKPVYRGSKVYMFKKTQIEKWHGKIYAHTPEVNHQVHMGTHAKKTFGETERKREFSFALAGFMFGVLLLLAICLPIITGLIGQIG